MLAIPCLAMASVLVRPFSTWSRAAATFVSQSQRLLPPPPMTASSPLDLYSLIQFLAELLRIETLFDAGQILFLRHAVGRRKQRRRFGCEPFSFRGQHFDQRAAVGQQRKLNVASRRTSRPSPDRRAETIFVARRTAETDERQPLGARIIGTVLVIPVEYARQRGESGRIARTDFPDDRFGNRLQIGLPHGNLFSLLPIGEQLLRPRENNLFDRLRRLYVIRGHFLRPGDLFKIDPLPGSYRSVYRPSAADQLFEPAGDIFGCDM